jgi:hypothetical protein
MESNILGVIELAAEVTAEGTTGGTTGDTTGGVGIPAIGLPLPVGGVTAPPPVGMPRFNAF